MSWNLFCLRDLIETNADLWLFRNQGIYFIEIGFKVQICFDN